MSFYRASFKHYVYRFVTYFSARGHMWAVKLVRWEFERKTKKDFTNVQQPK